VKPLRVISNDVQEAEPDGQSGEAPELFGAISPRLFNAMGLFLRCQCEFSRARTPRRVYCPIHGPGARR
jgi:hypothetical protein